VVQREPGDDGLVPPIKVLRRRVNGVYRAEGFRGPTRRYVLIVAMLVGLASLPTLAAITAGSNELEDGTTGAMDVPFLPLPSSGPVSPTPSGPPATALPGPSSAPPSSVTVRSPSAPKGETRKRKTKPGYAWSDDRRARPAAGSSAAGPPGAGFPGSGSSGGGSGSGSSGGSSGAGSPDREWSWLPGSKPGGAGSGGQNGGADDGDRPSRPGHPGNTPPPGWKPGGTSQPGGASPDEPRHPAAPGERDHPSRPRRPGEPLRPGQPPCQDPGRGPTRPSHHHRPDWSRHKHADDAAHRAHWSHHREGRKRAVTVHVPPTGRHGVSRTVRERPHDRDRYERPRPDREGGATKLSKLVRSIVSSRSSDRSESDRRSPVAERPHNIRSARAAERTHNSRRHHHAAEARMDEPQSGGRSYRGSHRAERQHSADDSAVAGHRGSRVGRHHADHTGRW
jgi:hypothetical protein